MEFSQYVRVLRRHRLLMLLSVLLCTGAAAAIAWTREPVYAAKTQLFVSTAGEPADPSQTYQGGLFSQQRVRSYARIVSTPPVVQAVIEELGLSDSVQDLQREITASVPADTVLVNITVEDRSPRKATAIANAVADQFPRFINRLETPSRGEESPVKVSVTSPARQPTTPVSPNKSIYLALGLMFGLVLGTAGALLREALDSRVREGRDAATILGAPVVGRLARYPGAKDAPLLMAEDPFSTEAEAYRLLRTNVRALSMDQGVRSLVVCSALPGEGKTFVTANLGVAFAQAGHRVIVVDADLRRPRLGEVFGADSSPGLVDVLAGKVSVEDAVRQHETLPLGIVPSGAPPANPSELLGSQQFAEALEALTRLADIVILDAPAWLPVTDAAVIARRGAGVIFVARVSSTRTDDLETAAQSLRTVDKEVLGVVLNWTSPRDGRAYGHYGAAPSD